MGRAAVRDDPDHVLDDAVERFDRFAHGLVHLEPMALSEVGATVRRFVAIVDRHLGPAGVADARRDRGAPHGRERAALLSREHDRFRVSLEQLTGLLGVVENDDHGGHRQALGQYGRLLVDALRTHRADERAGSRAGAPRAAPANDN